MKTVLLCLVVLHAIAVKSGDKGALSNPSLVLKPTNIVQICRRSSWL
jgi:hypothetical protein